MTVRYLACLVLGYLIGSLSVSILISKYIFHQDVRTLGSGNAGAANAARTLGPRVGALTLLGDFLKGIISMLVRVLNGRTPQEILDADLYFIDRIGLHEHLSPTRSNGLLAMVKKIMAYAVAFKATQG